MKKIGFMHISFAFLLVTVFGNCSKESTPPATPDTPSRISINDISRTEENGGTSQFGFTLSLDKPSSKVITVNFATVAGTAKAGEDYTHATQTVTFAANEVQKSINIAVTADDVKEGNEEFTISLTSPVNASIIKSTGTGTILNDDVRVPFNNIGYDAPTSYPGYALSWSDDFNGPALNLANWSNENGDGCPGNCGWGNNELEYYTDRADNLFFQDGKMIIEAKKENYAGKTYTSSKIVGRNKKPFKYGRIDIRAILPKGKGIWPAFWLLPQNNVYGGWPRSGEIDLMENIGHEPGKTYGTLHYGPGPGSLQLGSSYSLPSGIFNDQFHVFSIEWKQNEIKWFVDGNLYSTFGSANVGSNTWPFNEEFFMIINLAVGGNWPGNPDAATYFPQWLIVDYIRVYQ